jgi:hypothetical protein
VPPSPCRPALDTTERERRQLTDEERIQLATAARFARHTGTVAMAELARVWKISPKALYDIINRQRFTGSAAALRSGGPAHLLTDADEKVLSEVETLTKNATAWRLESYSWRAATLVTEARRCYSVLRRSSAV